MTSAVLILTLILLVVDSDGVTKKPPPERLKQVERWLNNPYKFSMKMVLVAVTAKCIVPLDSGLLIEDPNKASCDPRVELDIPRAEGEFIHKDAMKCCNEKKHGHKYVRSGECVASNRPAKGEFLCKCVKRGERCDGLVSTCCERKGLHEHVWTKDGDREGSSNPIPVVCSNSTNPPTCQLECPPKGTSCGNSKHIDNGMCCGKCDAVNAWSMEYECKS